MKIQHFTLHTYTIPLISGKMRSGILIELLADDEKRAWGEVAPLPGWSKETYKEALNQLLEKKKAILDISWEAANFSQKLASLNLFPSVIFGLESALLSLLAPLPKQTVATSALLMGTVDEILKLASLRLKEGFTSAKLKVSNMRLQEAEQVIWNLKDKFRLRIDVNRAWETEESLRFFSQFSQDAFDYVEEPFANPYDLNEFSHPLAVDESFPHDLSLKQLESLTPLKAVIYKPTLQGGLTNFTQLYEWAKEKKVEVVLSSSFESDIGIASIASLAHRYSLLLPVGIGTYHYLKEKLCAPPLQFSNSTISIPAHLIPKKDMLTSVGT